MSNMRGWGIRLQVLLLALVPTLIISVLLVAYFTSTRIEDVERVFRDRGEAIVLKLASAASNGVFSENKPSLQNLAKTTLRDYGVQGVAFYDAKGVELARAGIISQPFKPPANTNSSSAKHKIMTEERDSLSMALPIVNHRKWEKEGNLMGWVKIELDTTSVHLHEYQVLIHTTMILLLGLSISGLHALQMGRNVTRPILELAQVVERIKHGDLSTRVPISNYRELYVLESGINTMSRALQDAQTELQNEVIQATANLRRSLETIEIQNLELEIARQAAEANSQTKSEFLANMSHEIRTPLNGVIGFTNLLKRTALNTSQEEYVTTIQKSSKTLLSIINDILDFSKLEAGKLKIDRQIMNIRECVEETLTLLAPHSAEKSLVLVPLIYSNVPQLMLGDPLRIKQVITNLVNNAIKFTDHGSVIVRVMLESEGLAHAIIRISVIDTGIGLSEQQQKELFQSFHQVNLNLSQKAGGTGLGLVICKKLVEQMKGEIGLESELAKGSTFWFTFEVGKVLAHTPVKHYQMPMTSELFSKNVHILAVDDNPDNLRLITLLLGELGIRVTAVSSGQEALQAVYGGDFSLIFMDIRMPGMNGIEATQRIRRFEKDNKKNATPIIALTAHALITEQEALLAAGVDDYLSKPIDEDQLKALISKWIRHRDSNDSHPAIEPVVEHRVEGGGEHVGERDEMKRDEMKRDEMKRDETKLGALPIFDSMKVNPEEPKIIDWALAVKLVGGKKDLAEELFNKLRGSLKQDLEKIHAKFLIQEWEALRDEVHRLHGACCYCGVPKLKRCLQDFEGALGNKPSQETIAPRMEALIKRIDEVLTANEALLTHY